MRKSYWQLVLLGSILVVGIATTEEAPPRPRPPPPPPPPAPSPLYPGYNFLVLAQTWPPTLCMNKSASNCPTPVPDRFTIHGLWPTLNNSQQLSDCCVTQPGHPDCPFDSLKASNNSAQTLQELDRDWPNLYYKETNTNFLKHEWTKHGTCSLRYMIQTTYFANALRLFRTSDLTNAILKSSDFRNRTISIANLKKAVRTKTKSNVQVKCDSNSQVLEVRVCTTTDGSAFIDCAQEDACPGVTLPLLP